MVTPDNGCDTSTFVFVCTQDIKITGYSKFEAIHEYKTLLDYKLYLITFWVTLYLSLQVVSLFVYFLDLLHGQELRYLGHLDWGGQGSKGF